MVEGKIRLTLDFALSELDALQAVLHAIRAMPSQPLMHIMPALSDADLLAAQTDLLSQCALVETALAVTTSSLVHEP